MGEGAITLPTLDKERVIQDTVSAVLVSMEAIVQIEPSERRAYDSNQRLEYLGKSIVRGEDSDAIWMIWNIAYDANGNEVSRLRASNAFDQVWTGRALLTYK